MRKLQLFSAMLILFLLVPASITWAQVTKTLNGIVRYESGMAKTRFSTPNGEVVVTLPQSMSGAVITGTVSTEPAGKTEKEKNKNLKELLKFVVNLDGQKIPTTATPTNFDWLTHLDRQSRTPVELLNVSGAKVAELSLPPVLSAPATGVWQPDRTPLLTTPSNVLVKGDVLNVYTDKQFSPGEKFVLTDSKGHQFTVKPVCLSANQAVINVPAEAVIGELTIREEVWNQPISKFDISNAKVNMIDIKLTSPNTNLRPGQGSFVQAIISGVWEDHFAYNVDLRNLNPNTVTMEGGNLQRVYVSSDHSGFEDDTPNDQAHENYLIRRNITGVKPGSFSVSATLHEDYTTSNDPFRPQLNVLKTPEDFNAWANALKKDLQTHAKVSYDDETGTFIRVWVQRAIDNMPVCTSPEQLDEIKAVAYSLLQPLHVPKGAANTWISSYEAFKTSLKSLEPGLAEKTNLTDWDIVNNGIDYIERISYKSNDPSMIKDVTNARQIVNTIKETGETKENLTQLNQALSSLSSRTDQKLMSVSETNKILDWSLSDMGFSIYCFDKRTKDGIDPVKSMIGCLDPDKKILRVKPEYQQQVLNSLNAVPVGDGSYTINTVTASLTPVTYNIQVGSLTVANFYSAGWWDWWSKLPVPDPNKPNPEMVKDKTGTWCIFYKDAKCDPGKLNKPVTSSCKQEVVMEQTVLDIPPYMKSTIKYIPGSYYMYTNYPRGRCVKGTAICKEVYAIAQEWKTFQDADCSIPVENKISYHLSCL